MILLATNLILDQKVIISQGPNKRVLKLGCIIVRRRVQLIRSCAMARSHPVPGECKTTPLH